MFFTPVIRSNALYPTRGLDRAFERWLSDATADTSARGPQLQPGDGAYTLTLDLPGIAKEQLAISIEGSVVRLETTAEATRQFKAAYDIRHEIDAASSEAKLENGVLSLKLVKKVAVSNATTLAIQ